MTASPSGIPALPPPRSPASYAVALVCLGNICRSPMADVVLSARVAEAGLDGRVHVASSGTGGWHVGASMDERAAARLIGAGYDPTHHRAQQFDADWRERFDLVLVMDRANLRDVGGPDEAGRVRLFRDFDPDAAPGSEVPDPYQGGDDGFRDVLATVERTCDVLVDALGSALAEDAS